MLLDAQIKCSSVVYCSCDLFVIVQNFETFPKTQDGVHIALTEVKKSLDELVSQGTVTQAQTQHSLKDVQRVWSVFVVFYSATGISPLLNWNIPVAKLGRHDPEESAASCLFPRLCFLGHLLFL
eukprot:c12140_g1_i7.p1 GENE.c12140_g1_i7~~c12140_g1_i7.p1  ORF type:complete len:124 (-),score=25.82 c12140_g1_i7:64-435(-)